MFVPAAFSLAYFGTVLTMVEWGSMADGAAAVGSVGAAATALWIATKDRRARMREQMDADLARARLVLVQVAEPQGSAYFRIVVENFGPVPILDLTFETASLATAPQADCLPQPGADVAFEVVEPKRAPRTFFVTFVDTAGHPVIGTRVVDSHGNVTYPDADKRHVSATVQFTDAQGNRWRRTGSEPPRRVHR